MNSNYAADTMAVVLRLEKRRTGKKAKSILDEVEKGDATLFISAMVLAEIGYLSERNKIETNLQEFKDYCRKYPTVCVEAITEEVIHKSFQIKDIPELHDRIIAGTAYMKNVRLITNDRVIVNSKFLSTIW